MIFKNISNILILFFIFSCQSIDGVFSQDNINSNYINNKELEDKSKIDLNNNFLPTDINKDYYYNSSDKILKISEYKRKFILKNDINKFDEKKTLTKFISDKKLVSLSHKGILNIYDLRKYKLINKIDFKQYLNQDNSYATSTAKINKSYYASFSEGKIISFDFKGNIFWVKDLREILKTPIKILNDNLFIVLGNKVVLINSISGEIIWEFYFDNNNYLNSKGGDIVELKHFIYFILPNGNIGSIDTIFNEKNTNKLVSFNNDKSRNNDLNQLHAYKNFISIFNQSKYISTLNVVDNEFIIKNNLIDDVISSIYYNNSLFVLHKNLSLSAVNIFNNKYFWNINLSKYVNKNDLLVKIIPSTDSINLFFSGGLVLTLSPYDGEIISQYKLKIKDIINVDYHNEFLFFQLSNGKTIIFSK